MAVDKNVIDDQLGALGEFDQWFTKKEINYLPEVINEGEQIKAITSGVFEGNTWLIFATDHRLIFLDKGMLYGLKQLEMPMSQITGISHKVGLVMGEIEIYTAGEKKKIKSIVKKDVIKFSDILSSLVKQAQDASAAPVQHTDVVSQLEKLADLKSRGILTEEEFQAQKAKVLA